MINPILNSQLKKYNPRNTNEEENALKEILQEVALFSLSTTDFFSKALFQGGTALRILHQLPRFSEDLDFVLKRPDPQFQWEKYIDQMKKSFALYGITPEIMDRKKSKTAVQKLFLKDNSIGKILTLNFHRHTHQKMWIKFEIDTNPPFGSLEERRYLVFPQDCAIAAQDLSTNFAGKCHALLCRQYLKGRDWFDFAWYVAGDTPINFEFLQHAFEQQGPWQQQSVAFNDAWLIDALRTKIQKINWQKAKEEVMQFVNPQLEHSLTLWSADFFMDRVQKLENILKLYKLY